MKDFIAGDIAKLRLSGKIVDVVVLRSFTEKNEGKVYNVVKTTGGLPFSFYADDPDFLEVNK